MILGGGTIGTMGNSQLVLTDLDLKGQNATVTGLT
jgi:hypothetical protein